MRTPHWFRSSLRLGACAGLALGAGCASSSRTGGGADEAPPSRETADRGGYAAQPVRGPTQVNRLTRADIENAGTSDLLSIIETKLPGVRVVRRGSDVAVQIRGAASFMSGSDALVLIDGVEGSLTSVSIHEVQAVEVLKDAAAAIYGVRGANGVLLITTRRR